MPFRYLTRTAHTPVSAHGIEIRNNFGVVVATATSPPMADTLAALINMGHPFAQQQEKDHNAKESRRMLGLPKRGA